VVRSAPSRRAAGRSLAKLFATDPLAAVRVAPRTPRSHRNRGDEPVELWAISRRLDRGDATKIDDFWPADPAAVQRRAP